MNLFFKASDKEPVRRSQFPPFKPSSLKKDSSTTSLKEKEKTIESKLIVTQEYIESDRKIELQQQEIDEFQDPIPKVEKHDENQIALEDQEHYEEADNIGDPTQPVEVQFVIEGEDDDDDNKVVEESLQVKIDEPTILLSTSQRPEKPNLSKPQQFALKPNPAYSEKEKPRGFKTPIKNII